ncbi:MAG: sigma-70 family RNA polymerase sigma factor, partial [Candidatus Fonsibacter ubiquis]|nr:sigma-70 family RNA polymerase sigma factor [Candidatus Fonsibacter ubiquis]
MEKIEKNSNLPILSPEGSLNSYLLKIRKFPMLEPEQEYILAKNWREKGDRESAHTLVTSHLRLVAKIAMGYRGYGLPVGELISEGNIGLMQEYILRSWSLVKIGTTAAQKKLFFNLRKLKNQIFAIESGDMTNAHVKEIANRLDVNEDEVISMNRRMAGQEQSLNAKISDEEQGGQWQDWIVDENADQELLISQRQELDQKHALLQTALKVLDQREKEILYDRKLIDEPKTLEELSQKYKISRERVRQIENRAFEKVQKAMLENIKTKP